ncbi:MBOAT family O-acyltransferase [Flavobacterium luminosum]|uniref:MBOAT family protein n=1 Tax=Flavobacterium luminosum TaxID=2949086 RepID=A0ABT0TP83_9FLAO|nr:MBOAT family O-acyltransferase [Flavobacterium sp. HXWNR70]MCL9809086.1 MBOAT family protein [Flavobacterium sp. HXWNR70]
MLFNTFTFAWFFPLVFVLYWLLQKKDLKWQNGLLIVASYYFYACWNWKFLFLLIFSTALDYASGIQIEKSTSEKKRKFWFWLSILINLGFLGVFKYYNFFVDSLVELFASFGVSLHLATLQVLLPVGISFYTFHGLSYVIDIYKRRIAAERDFVVYSLFVSYFPLLVAGPIERATHLLPQLKQKRIFTYEQGVSGLRQILWGLFKKIVIADTCAQYANPIFNNPEAYSGSTLFMGALFFTFQIYGDFSGYSDIALGTSRLLGIELLKNFSFPYFSRDIAEFWRRWHISLSTWFKDYVYIPLGGSQGGRWMQIRNTFIIFLVSGFWHGANWTFIAWGFLNALYFLPLLLTNKNRSHVEIVANHSMFPSFKEIIGMGITFLLTVFAWIFFRAPSVSDALYFIQKICSKSVLQWPTVRPTFLIVLLLFFVLVEWWGRKGNFALEKLWVKQSRILRWSLYLLLLVLLFLFQGEPETFIYFQF